MANDYIKLNRQLKRGMRFFRYHTEGLSEDDLSNLRANFRHEVLDPLNKSLLDDLQATETREDITAIQRALSVFDGHIVKIG